MSFTSWGSSSGTVSTSGFEDWSSGSWRQRFPDNSGTKNPQTDPEKTQRIAYLEQQISQMEETVRNSDARVDQAKNRVDQLKNQLSNTRDRAYNARERHLELGKKVAGLQGKQLANKEHIARLEERLANCHDTWTINDIKSELSRRQDARWTIADEISRATDAYNNATDNMNSLENKVSELERNVDQASNHVYECQENARLKKERLAEFRSELSNLKGGW